MFLIQSEQYYSLKSRSGSVMIIPRAEVEEVSPALPITDVKVPKNE